MKILYATRLFSGLERSFIDKKWDPIGVPTIYKLIEELDKSHNVRFIFSSKDWSNGWLLSWRCSKDKVISIDGLNNKVEVLAGVPYFFSWLPRRIAIIFREVRQYTNLIINVLRFKPDIFYCDHANVIVGAILSRVQQRTLIIYRVMGIDPTMRVALTSNNIIYKVFKWAYKSPFDLVIFTQEGSGFELWARQALLKGVKTKILLNGVDEINSSNTTIPDGELQNVPKDKKIILFVGKLEEYKGCYDFLNAILFLIDKGVNDIHALIIGYGGEELKLKKIVKDRGHEKRFTFISELSHKQIFSAHRMSYIYVSMNHEGNLSNANLEAIQLNDCIIIPSAQTDSGIDIVTHQLLGDSITSVPIKSPMLLANSIHKLVLSESYREKKMELIKNKKTDFLWSWEERIKTEITLLKELIEK
ncbi:glycosyltransferase family 4 protein [Candidatus Woesearchaeota archaeon]|nr:glycosyltransferase family 4 protein [Candidatus Woesearchaeota archaeon]